MDINEQKRIFYDPLSIEDCGHCRCYFSQSSDNMKLIDLNDIINDIKNIKIKWFINC